MTSKLLAPLRQKPAWLENGLGLRILFEGRAFIALIVIVIVFSALSPNYFTVENLLVMSRHVAVNAILAIGMLMVILNAGIDLVMTFQHGASQFLGMVRGLVPTTVPQERIDDAARRILVAKCEMGLLDGAVANAQAE